ncbi:unnamed protein product, partial [Laminaria digitata]
FISCIRSVCGTLAHILAVTRRRGACFDLFSFRLRATPSRRCYAVPGTRLSNIENSARLSPDNTQTPALPPPCMIMIPLPVLLRGKVGVGWQRCCKTRQSLR